MSDHIYPKDDQVYIQLWHGTPLKRLGYDINISDNAMNQKAKSVKNIRLMQASLNISCPVALCGRKVYFRLEFGGYRQNGYCFGAWLSEK